MTDQLNAYLDYELPEAERAAVREHLRRCPECENELATLRAAKQLLADVPVVRPPRSFVLSVEQAEALKARPVPRTALAAPQSRVPRLVLGLRLAASAAFVLALLLFGTDLLTSTTPAASTLALPQAEANQSVPAAGRAATEPTLGLSSASAAATNTTAPAAAMLAPAGTPAPGGAADTAALTASAPLPPPMPSEVAAASGATGGGPAAAPSAAKVAAPTSTAALAMGAAPPPAPTAAADQANAATAAHTEPGIGAAPLPAPPPGRDLHLLPWELGLGLLALLLATASIFLPRRDS